jgi:Flp pilus assembly pilin Flp
MGWGYPKIICRAWCRDRSGATAIEYALIAAGISLALAVVVFVFGDDLGQFFLDLAAALQS